MSQKALLRLGTFGLVLSLGLVAACNSAAPTPTANPDVPTVVVPFTPNPNEVPLPTLLPTVVVPVSPIPVTVTPTPITTIPTATPIGATATLSAATGAPATETPAPTFAPLPPLPEGTPKVFVTAIRVDPAQPNADVPGMFFVTFQNASGQDQGYSWKIEIWRDDKRFGETTPESSTMPLGVSTLTTTGWAPRGQGECVPYRAKVVAIDEDDNRADFVQPNGEPLWFDFTICP